MRKYPQPLQSIRRRDDKTGYETPIGTLPSVTTILSATSPPEAKARLQAWLERPGAHEESMRACKRGTWVHEQLENYLRRQPIKRNLAFNPYLNSVLPWAQANIIEPCMIEAPVWHPAGFSGTFDLICWLDQFHELTILDWKSSARPRGPDLVDNYCDQLAAYRAAAINTYGVKTDRGALVIARPAASKPDVWIIDQSELDRRELKFMRRVEEFQKQQDKIEIANR